MADLDELRAFLAIVEHGSAKGFARAVREAGFSGPLGKRAISIVPIQSIRTLELLRQIQINVPVTVVVKCRDATTESRFDLIGKDAGFFGAKLNELKLPTNNGSLSEQHKQT